MLSLFFFVLKLWAKCKLPPTEDLLYKYLFYIHETKNNFFKIVPIFPVLYPTINSTW